MTAPLTAPRRLAAALLAAPLVLLAACQGSASVGSAPAVSASDVEDQMVTTYSAQGVTKDMVDCPEDLPGKVGSTITCTITENDGTITDFKVTVTSVDGTDVKFDLEPQDGSGQ